MKWYNGDIAQAVASSKAKGAIFVVYIEGNDDQSKKITDLIDNGVLGQHLEKEHFVAIKLEQGSLPHQQFSEIYKEPSVPSVYFIGKNGVPLDIIKGGDNLDNVSQRVENILSKAGITFTKPSSSNASETFIQSERTQQNENVACENGVCYVKNDVNTSEPSELENILSPEEKVQRAKDLIEEKRIAKEAEEKEKERLKELERRKMGQDVQQLKKWQEDQELKQMLEERDKEKRENQLARQRVLEQIAQDKAERQARMQQPQAETSRVSTPPTVRARSNSTRLQFKLPDGTSNTQEFANEDSLQTVVTYIETELQLPFNKFKLSTTFPRREFTVNDYSQSLLDLQLTPNAVMLILPLNQSAVSTNSGNTFSTLIWSLFAPIFNLFGYIKNMIFGGNNSGNNANAAKPSEAQPETKPSNAYNRRIMRDSTVVRRQGNIHRLTDRNDSDDEGNTWNGNSTQQM